MRTRTVKVMRLLEALHERGWEIVEAEPVAPAHREVVDLVDETRDERADYARSIGQNIQA